MMSDRDDESDLGESSVAGSSSFAQDDPAAWFDDGDSSPSVPKHDEPAETASRPDGWVDDDFLIEAPDPDEIRATKDGWRRWLPAGMFVGGVVALAAVGFAVFGGGGSDDSTQEAEALVPQAQTGPYAGAASSPEQDCVADEDGVTAGDGEGDRDSVTGVVLAFNHGYYVDRSAESALAVADSARFDADALQAGIETVPDGTTHCVRAEVEGSSATVELTESRPGGESEVYEQTVETTEEDGQVSITEIREAESEGDDSDDDET